MPYVRIYVDTHARPYTSPITRSISSCFRGLRMMPWFGPPLPSPTLPFPYQTASQPANVTSSQLLPKKKNADARESPPPPFSSPLAPSHDHRPCFPGFEKYCTVQVRSPPPPPPPTTRVPFRFPPSSSPPPGPFSLSFCCCSPPRFACRSCEEKKDTRLRLVRRKV